MDGTLSLARTADMRYVGQGYELSVPIPDGPVDGGRRPRSAARSTASTPTATATRTRRPPSSS